MSKVHDSDLKNWQEKARSGFYIGADDAAMIPLAGKNGYLLRIFLKNDVVHVPKLVFNWIYKPANYYGSNIFSFVERIQKELTEMGFQPTNDCISRIQEAVSKCFLKYHND